jgi:hypothetical protein
MDKKHRGAHSELIACAWLLAEGYEVFRNVSAHGFADIIALKDGKTFFFDVKTSSASYKPRISASQIKKGILPLHVTEAGECSIDWLPTGRAAARKCVCEKCHTEFVLEPGRLGQKYCSDGCYNAAKARRYRARMGAGGPHKRPPVSLVESQAPGARRPRITRPRPRLGRCEALPGV